MDENEKCCMAITPPKSFDVIVIGAGIAGCSTAWALSKKGFSVCLIERESEICPHASGNSRAAVMPVLTAEKTKISEFSEAAFSFFIENFSGDEHSFFKQTGLIQIAYNAQKKKRYKKAQSNHVFDSVPVEFCDAKQLSEAAQIEVNENGIFFEQAGWLCPKDFSRYLLNNVKNVQISSGVLEIRKDKIRWLCKTKNEELSADHVIVSTAYDMKLLGPKLQLPLRKLRGQVVELKTSETISAQGPVICFDGYLLPPQEGWHLLGASYDRNSKEAVIKDVDNTELWNRLSESFPKLKNSAPRFRNARASFRTTTPDHLPIADQIERGLWLLTGLGSRGFTYAPYLAHRLTHCLLENRPMDFLVSLNRRALLNSPARSENQNSLKTQAQRSSK